MTRSDKYALFMHGAGTVACIDYATDFLAAGRPALGGLFSGLALVLVLSAVLFTPGVLGGRT